MNETPCGGCETPIEDLLGTVPMHARLIIKEDPSPGGFFLGSRSIPIGRLSGDASQLIKTLRKQLAEKTVQAMRWEATAKDYANNAGHWRERANYWEATARDYHTAKQEREKTQAEIGRGLAEMLATSLEVHHLLARTLDRQVSPQPEGPSPGPHRWVEVPCHRKN